jgi:RsiW-degrading membrane proteinase PrsW (M82 family)
MKLYLTINSGSIAGQSFELESGFLTIGRGDTCSIRFDPLNERIASKQHAFIEAKPEGYYLTDNNSTNGTFLNGRQVQTAKINSGDTIQFGKNGITANARIDDGVTLGAEAAAHGQSFRDYQVEQFNQIAQQEPESFQSSLANFGLGGRQEIKKEPSQTGRYVGIAITLFALVFLSLIVVLIMFASVGIVPAVIAAIVAFVPAMFYLLPLIWLDRYDPEPLWLLALAFSWGALVSVIVSFILNTVFGIAVGVTVSPELGQIGGAVISAPIVEEASKGVGLLILLIFFRRYFDDILDGIVFAGVIALGFATVENVLYYGRGIAESGLPGLVLLFFMRGILSPFAHVSFTSMTGIGCGIARESHNTAVKILVPIAGYIGAVSLHMLWNGMAVFGGFRNFLLGYLIIEIPFFLIFLGFSFYIMRRQNKILKEMLAIDIATGLIPEEHAKKSMSAFRSSGWILGGLFEGKFKARSRYVRAIGKLGLSYWHIQRATAAQGQTGSFQQNPILREEVLKWRDQV